MHIYFSGIGGTAIGPLAQLTRQIGHEVSGSDKQDSQYIEYLRKHGINDIHIGQTEVGIAKVHAEKPIDWFVYTSALTLENPNPPEIEFCKKNGIKVSKRYELINKIIEEKNLKMVAIAGTHGKTTTTAMVIWLFKQLGIPVSYSVGAKISFGEMGEYDPKSEYFVYEADEFDRNFLNFKPYVSLITGVTWDHHEIFPTQEDYNQAFLDFCAQSEHVVMWEEDQDHLSFKPTGDDVMLRTAKHEHDYKMLPLKGRFNRRDARLALEGLHVLGLLPKDPAMAVNFKLFSGLQRRMEEITPGLYSDYAHTPEKIRGAMSVALEVAKDHDQKVVVVYEPLTNRRQHYMIDDYKDCFAGAEHVYWTPSYLAREDPYQFVLPPSELISHLDDPSIAEPAELNDELQESIQKHLDAGDMVVAMSGGGGGSLDEWLRQKFK